MLRDVRYDLADGGECVAEGLTFRAEGQLSPMSGNASAAMAAALRMRSRPLSRLAVSQDMQKFSLEALGRQLLERAGAAGGGHSADTVVGGHERILRQTVIAMVKGAVWPSMRTRARRPCTSCADACGCQPGTCLGRGGPVTCLSCRTRATAWRRWRPRLCC